MSSPYTSQQEGTLGSLGDASSLGYKSSIASHAAPYASIDDGRTFLGHPVGLAFLCFTEAWERFSFYGMSSLLLLYMIQYLLLPETVANVHGLSTIRSGVEALTGPLSNQAFASQLLGLYTALVYFTPILGGLLADRLTGRRVAIVCGAAMMAAGHIFMAFDASFVLALVLMIVGTGCLKGNISTQIGHLYRPGDESQRTRAFAIFSAAINFGALTGPLVCGVLAQAYGWHMGFGVASILMFVALVAYIAGWKHFPPEDRRERRKSARPPLSARDWEVIATLIAIMLIAMFPIAAYYQEFNAGLLLIEQSVDRNFLGWAVPTSSFVALDGLFCILLVPIVIAVWKWQARRGLEPGDLAKIAIGYLIAAIASSLMTIPAMQVDRGETISMAWPVLLYALNSLAFLFYWPTLLALFSRAAPAAVNSTMMGALFLSLFFGNLLVGTLATWWERMPHVDFFKLHGALAFGPCVLMLLAMRFFDRRLASESA